MYHIITDQYGRTRGLINDEREYELPDDWDATILHDWDGWVDTLELLN